MAGLTCKVCESTLIDTQVRVVYDNRTVHTNESAIKATKWAVNNLKTPCILRYIYVCNKCQYEDLKFERVFRDRI